MKFELSLPKVVVIGMQMVAVLLCARSGFIAKDTLSWHETHDEYIVAHNLHDRCSPSIRIGQGLWPEVADSAIDKAQTEVRDDSCFL